MFTRLIRYLRRQPPYLRSYFSVVAASSFTAVVALIWLYNLPHQITVLRQVNTLEPITGLFDEISVQTASVRTAFEAAEETETIDDANANFVQSALYDASQKKVNHKTPTSTAADATSAISVNSIGTRRTSTTTSIAGSSTEPATAFVRVVAVPAATTTPTTTRATTTQS